MVTLKDIAQEAGVSTMTVSRVINGNTEKVSEKTARRVLDIVRKRGYVPNSSARSLVAKSSNIITIIIAMASFDRFPISPHNASMISVIAKRVQSEGYTLMVRFVEHYGEVTANLRAWNVEGAILFGVDDQDIWRIMRENDIPLVFTDSYSSFRQAVNVGSDDFKGGFLAAEHFLEHGHRQVAFAAPEMKTNSNFHQRFLGFCRGLEEHGLRLDDRHLFLNRDSTLLAGGLVEAAGEGVTGVFVPADNIAVEVMEACKNGGLSVPGDLSFIGFDNQTVSFYVYPKLTTIGQDVDLKARVAVDLLFEQMRSHSPVSQSRVLDVGLIDRDSVRTIE